MIRAKTLTFAGILAMTAYVLYHNERFLIEPSVRIGAPARGALRVPSDVDRLFQARDEENGCLAFSGNQVLRELENAGPSGEQCRDASLLDVRR
jgi:hypothetical protein